MITEFIAQIVQQGGRFRVALTPVSQGGASPIVATAWAEQDGRIFEANDYQEAEAFIGQLPGMFWSACQTLTGTLLAADPPGPKPRKHSAKSQRSTR